MKCPCCGAAELVHGTKDMAYVYKGQPTTIKAITGDFCPSCGDAVLDEANSNSSLRQMAAFRAEVNAAHVEPSFIAETRAKLGLDQRAAARIFGGGVNAFSRYETGKTQPPLSMVHLLRLLSNHPELLQEITRGNDERLERHLAA